jgi:hypothetical protein
MTLIVQGVLTDLSELYNRFCGVHNVAIRHDKLYLSLVEREEYERDSDSRLINSKRCSRCYKIGTQVALEDWGLRRANQRSVPINTESACSAIAKSKR